MSQFDALREFLSPAFKALVESIDSLGINSCCLLVAKQIVAYLPHNESLIESPVFQTVCMSWDRFALSRVRCPKVIRVVGFREVFECCRSLDGSRFLKA
jgi:hypothetical protein